jgi:hypothetical protein
MKYLEKRKKKRFLKIQLAVVLFLVTVVWAKAQAISENTGDLTGEDVLYAERKLFRFGFWLAKTGGDIDETRRYAWLAFQRLEGLPQTGEPGKKELLRLLKTSRPPKPKVTGYTHFEVYLKKQILFLVDESGKISHIIPVSTGTGRKFTEGGRTRRAVTPRGVFTVYRKAEYWKGSPLGNMYFPSYIVGGVAIHGGNFFPNRPSTYGCIKVPLVFAAELSRLMPLQTIVVVY